MYQLQSFQEQPEDFESQWLGNLEFSLVIVIHLYSYNLAFKIAG